MITAGIDAGSRAIKIVIYDTERRAILAAGVADQGVAQERRSRELFEKLLDEQRIARGAVAKIVATGYARANILLADTTITEITCHAAGVHHVTPTAATVIEIGGQDSKLLLLQPDGSVRDFVMNDRCAAGTGCFLEIAAKRLEIDLQSYRHDSAAPSIPIRISSTCVVFAETEIIGLLASGNPPTAIFSGVLAAIATRVNAMTGGRVTPPVVFTGGVALIPGMRQALVSALGAPVTIAPHAQLTGAIGAALLAAQR
jgi:predicted CoA-substrate-specific enzyme activase